MRSALGRDRSASPSASTGLLASEDFEAAFTDETEAVVSVEDGKVDSMAGSTSATPVQPMNAPSSTSGLVESKAIDSTRAQGKRAKKRKWQENAAKARET